MKRWPRPREEESMAKKFAIFPFSLFSSSLEPSLLVTISTREESAGKDKCLKMLFALIAIKHHAWNAQHQLQMAVINVTLGSCSTNNQDVRSVKRLTTRDVSSAAYHLMVLLNNAINAMRDSDLKMASASHAHNQNFVQSAVNKSVLNVRKVQLWMTRATVCHAPRI